MLQEKSSSLKGEHLALQCLNFLNFVGHFCHPGSESVYKMRIQIQPTKKNADPESGSTTPEKSLKFSQNLIIYDTLFNLFFRMA
jgi:hypothetical protein